ncbi:MAG: ABC transporter permease [Clostridiaceae bacterium]|nr:ABC transporter permease [Clostridiaceae bacterium]
MLAKLLKYELKATARWFIPLYAALVMFTLISRVLLHNDTSVLQESASFWRIAVFLSMFIYVFLFIGILVVTLVVEIQRFYKNLLGDEGYLMFTLPVQTWKHIVSKLLIAMLWNLLSAVIGLCSIMLLVPAQELKELGLLFMNIKEYLGTMGYFSISLLLFTSLVFGVIEMYTAIALGHLFRKHKLLASFGMYIGINTVAQIVYMLIIPFFQNNLVLRPAPSLYPEQLNVLFLVSALSFAILSAACYIVTNIILKRKLNLE